MMWMDGSNQSHSHSDFLDHNLDVLASCLNMSEHVCCMIGQIRIKTNVNECSAGCWRSCAGENCCQNHYIGPGKITFSHELPGDVNIFDDYNQFHSLFFNSFPVTHGSNALSLSLSLAQILPFAVNPSEGWIINTGCFIFGTSNLRVSGRFSSCGVCLCAQEGAFMVEVTCKDQNPGTFYAGGYGALEVCFNSNLLN